MAAVAPPSSSVPGHPLAAPVYSYLPPRRGGMATPHTDSTEFHRAVQAFLAAAASEVRVRAL